MDPKSIKVRGGKQLNYEKPVRVYRNLRRHCYSIKQGGRVVAYADTILLNNPNFLVSESGRQRVLREGRKNVHAYIEGLITFTPFKGYMSLNWRPLTYNPYEHTAFVDGPTQTKVITAQQVLMTPNGVLYYE